MIRAGLMPSSKARRNTSYNAVGALPIATIWPSNCLPNVRIAAMERVTPNSLAILATFSSLIKQCTSLPRILRAGLEIPVRTISTSV